MSARTSPDLPNLPILHVLDDLKSAVKENAQVILSAPPGAGKTTAVPPALLDQVVGTIWMIEPRRIAARNAAHGIAERLGEEVGKRVGYAVRGESARSDATRILVVTPGVFLNQIQRDPSLEGIAAVILDEFHERQISVDLALTLTLDAQAALRDDLRLLVMSATLNSAELLHAMPAAKQIESHGRSFEIDVHYWEESPVGAISDAMEQFPGDALVFLPGRRDLERAQEALGPKFCQRHSVRLLHGGLTLTEQRAAIAPALTAQRRVILSTNIAESSLTVPGVRIVIDSGLERRMEFDPNSSISQLTTRPISRASAVQRAGRAGRTEPGVAIRLWRKAAHGARPEQTAPEIERSDLADLALQLASWGVTSDETDALTWVTPPPVGNLAEAKTRLGPDWLSAIDAEGRPSDLGERLSTLPMGVHEAALSLNGFPEFALSVREQMTSSDHPDLRRAVRQVSARDLKQIKRLMPSNTSKVDDDDSACALARAFPHWVARRRANSSPPSYLTSRGQAFTLRPDGPLGAPEFLAIAAVHSSDRQRERDPVISAALPLTRADVLKVFSDRIVQKQRVEWSNQHDRLIVRTEQCLGEIVLEQTPLKPDQIDSELRDQAVIAQLVRRKLDSLLPPAASNFLARLRLAGMDAEVESLQWLCGWLDGVQTKEDFKQIDWSAALRARLDWDQQQLLDKRFPAKLPLPSGRSGTIDYSLEPPRLAGKLQEFFGSDATPAVDGGKLTLALDLLSPANRTLALTQDLPAFWRGAYKEVAKEGRASYPRHPWPDDPASATATALTKAKLAKRTS